MEVIAVATSTSIDDGRSLGRRRPREASWSSSSTENSEERPSSPRRRSSTPRLT
jgi:hypothetical protein